MQAILFAATTKTPASIQFYRDKLGFSLVADTAYALVFDVEGTMLRVQKVKETVPVPYTTLGFAVPDITACVADLGTKGVDFEFYDILEQDESGIWTAPDGTRVAWCRDPDDSLVSFTQEAERS